MTPVGYAVTYRGEPRPVQTMMGAADLMVELWTKEGPDQDIRVDVLADDGSLHPINGWQRSVIESRVKFRALVSRIWP